MNVNEEYEALFECDFSAAREALEAAKAAARAEWDAAVALEKAARRKSPSKGRKARDVELPMEWYDSLRQRLYDRHRIEELEGGLEEHRDSRDEQLDRLAKEVVFSPPVDPQCWYRVKASDTETYRSQGGRHAYARGSLAPNADSLRSRGFHVHVRSVTRWRSADGYEATTYELWSDCPPWMFDAAKRLITLKEAIRSYHAAGVNPRVYLPFLPYSIEEYSVEYGWPPAHRSAVAVQTV